MSSLWTISFNVTNKNKNRKPLAMLLDRLKELSGVPQLKAISSLLWSASGTSWVVLHSVLGCLFSLSKPASPSSSTASSSGSSSVAIMSPPLKQMLWRTAQAVMTCNREGKKLNWCIKIYTFLNLKNVRCQCVHLHVEQRCGAPLYVPDGHKLPGG